MQTKKYKYVELFMVFVLVPISFAIQFSIAIKLFIGAVGFAYVMYVLVKIEKLKFAITKGIKWKQFWRLTAIKLFIIAILTSFYMWFIDPSNFYVVIRTKPLLWCFILVVYSVFSVYPQEVIYRAFFFNRYQNLFKNKTYFVVLNALLFSLAHLFFKNSLVLLLTFVGGVLFALTFAKTKSTLLVSVEHAVYGCWLFTVGMGDMLGFPS